LRSAVSGEGLFGFRMITCRRITHGTGRRSFLPRPHRDVKRRVRVLVVCEEIPTPRWVVYDAFRFGIDLPEGAETMGQERAYTAPIWYTP
jgi:hypothetical protein